MSLLAHAGRLVDRIKINSLARVEREDGAVWTKRRQPAARLVIPVANGFFRLAGNPITILSETKAWHDWEIGSLRALHGTDFAAWGDDDGVLHVAELPGESLSTHLNAGTTTEEMFAAAAREFRRAHAVHSDWFGAAWSHGDPHSGNVIFDARDGRARLMDFEVRHDDALCADARHTDDLLIFLQDTLGRMPRPQWLQSASVFVRSYDRAEITARLLDRLSAPRGFARIWWAVRTTYLAPSELAGRLHALREALAA
jgi:hypothetical protein